LVWAQRLGPLSRFLSSVVGVGTSSLVEFSGIPSTYQHLRLHIVARSTRTGVGGDLLDIRFNDSTTGYYDHVLQNVNGSISNDQNLNTQTHIDIQRVPSVQNSANVFGGFTIDIPDYASGSKVKSLLSKSGAASDSDPASNQVTLGSAFWNNTNAINKISVRSSYGDNFVQYSTFALYGWKG